MWHFGVSHILSIRGCNGNGPVLYCNGLTKYYVKRYCCSCTNTLLYYYNRDNSILSPRFRSSRVYARNIVFVRFVCVVGVRDGLRYTRVICRTESYSSLHLFAAVSAIAPSPGIIDGAHLPRLIYNIILCRRNTYIYIYTGSRYLYTEPARLCNRNTLLESRPLWAANARPSFLQWTWTSYNVGGP